MATSQQYDATSVSSLYNRSFRCAHVPVVDFAYGC